MSRQLHGLTLSLFLLAFAAAVPASHAAAPFTYRWEAASGQTPEQGCPNWLLSDNSPGSPSISGGVLTISTPANNADNSSYYVRAPEITLPDTTVLEFRCRYVSGASSSGARAPIMVNIYLGAFKMTSLGIALDHAFLLNGDLSVGSSANVDTHTAFHTWQLIVTGGTNVQVTYDGAPLLSGVRYSNANGTSIVEMSWGEGSSLAYGTSEWEYVQHNAATPTCVTANRSTTWGTLKSLYR
jgi:hypothetical protein